jgi:hypothetical protein
LAINMIRPVPIDLEPKRQNRWMMEFPSELGMDNMEWVVQTSSRPKLSISETEIPYMNTSTWVAGRSIWENMEVTFIDCIGPSTSQKIMDWVRMCIEHTTGRMGYATNYKKTIILKMLDPAGQIVEKWTLNGCFITAADFGGLDMSTDDLAEVSVTLRYDRAVLNF